MGPDGKIWMPLTNYSNMNPKNGAFTPFMGVNVFTSIDNAKTWNLESYINYIPDNEENEFAFMCGGYCEPTIEFCPNGDVVMIIRTADVCKGDKECSPTYITRSHDNGKTLDKPVRFMDYGVLPKSCICKDKMVVITGRPGIAIKVTEDKDWTKWSEEIEVITKDDRGYLNNEHPDKSNFYQWVGSCCNCSIINIDDETCMIAYSDFYHQCEDGISRKAINTRIFKIKD